MNILFFNSRTFLTREVVNALKRRKGHRIIAVDIELSPDSSLVPSIIERLRPYLPGLAIFINNGGCDFRGELFRELSESGSLIVNWYTDYPFYDECFHGRRMVPDQRRIDLVSEESYVDEMAERGFRAFFMPLATDTSFFNTDDEVEKQRDIAFVGNSSFEFLDSIINEERSSELQKLLTLQVDMKNRYFADPRFDIHGFLKENRHLWEGKTNLQEQVLLFCIEWLAGYLYRREFIKGIAEKYGSRFTCFGDPYWQKFIDSSLVSADACYYTNLCRYYRSTRVNLNVNRIQIRKSFTQRVFDCAASGSFLLTDRRECNTRFFKVSGADREMVQYDSLEECCDLIDYYLVHEEEREAIASAARRKVLAEHTYDHRIDQIFELCRKVWGT